MGHKTLTNFALLENEHRIGRWWSRSQSCAKPFSWNWVWFARKSNSFLQEMFHTTHWFETVARGISEMAMFLVVRQSNKWTTIFLSEAKTTLNDKWNYYQLYQASVAESSQNYPWWVANCMGDREAKVGNFIKHNVVFILKYPLVDTSQMCPKGIFKMTFWHQNSQKKLHFDSLKCGTWMPKSV